jgi:hypothetical protein
MEQKPPGRLVLLYFGDEDRAQEFFTNNPDARVVGMYEDPKGKECRCRSQKTARNKDFGWGPQHEFWGWQRHSMCSRAGVWWRRNYGRRLFLSLGVNLLGDKAPKIFQSPQGWGHENYRPGEGEV